MKQLILLEKGKHSFKNYKNINTSEKSIMLHLIKAL